MFPSHYNPLQWNQAQGLSRQSCARIFRDGGSPADALSAFGLASESPDKTDWSKAVELIAEHLCQSLPRTSKKAA